MARPCKYFINNSISSIALLISLVLSHSTSISSLSVARCFDKSATFCLISFAL